MKHWITAFVISAATVFTVAGCKDNGEGGEASGADVPAVEASPECKAAGEQVQALRLQKTPADAPDAEKSKAYGESRQLGDKVAAACTTNNWPAEAIECIKGAQDLTACQDKLPPDQQKLLPAI